VTQLAAAVEALAARLSHVDVTLLALALALNLCNLLLRSAAWRATLTAAMPQARIRGRSVTGAYLAGTGVNAVLPARSGDVVRVVLAGRSIPGACTVSVASSLLVETLLDAIVGAALIGWAVWSGSLPLRRLSPDAIDPRLTAGLAVLLVVGLTVVGLVRGQGQLRRLLRGLARGLAILGHPRAYLLRVAAPQALAWGFRVASTAFLLEAFHIAGGIDAAVLALVAGSVATLVPLTPGGFGTQQALLALLLAPYASPAAAISYGLGSQLALTTMNVALGGTCMGVMLGTMPWRAQARLAAAQPVPAPAPAPVAATVPVAVAAAPVE
jgi:uncharacterized membrane protein YbhN (UPF0104 family)